MPKPMRDFENNPPNLALLRYATVRELKASEAGETWTALSSQGCPACVTSQCPGARGGRGKGGGLVFVCFCCCFGSTTRVPAALSGPELSRLLSASATAPMGTIIRRQGGPAGFPVRLGHDASGRRGRRAWNFCCKCLLRRRQCLSALVLSTGKFLR